jgi:hypothetical protein
MSKYNENSPFIDQETEIQRGVTCHVWLTLVLSSSKLMVEVEFLTSRFYQGNKKKGGVIFPGNSSLTNTGVKFLKVSYCFEMTNSKALWINQKLQER